MVIVAEGVDSAYNVAQKIKDATSLDTRVTVLGHVQRGRGAHLPRPDRRHLYGL